MPLVGVKEPSPHQRPLIVHGEKRVAHRCYQRLLCTRKLCGQRVRKAQVSLSDELCERCGVAEVRCAICSHGAIRPRLQQHGSCSRVDEEGRKPAHKRVLRQSACELACRILCVVVHGAVIPSVGLNEQLLDLHERQVLVANAASCTQLG
eukprot:1242616-Prymnesium_polylepis.1